MGSAADRPTASDPAGPPAARVSVKNPAAVSTAVAAITASCNVAGEDIRGHHKSSPVVVVYGAAVGHSAVAGLAAIATLITAVAAVAAAAAAATRGAVGQELAVIDIELPEVANCTTQTRPA